MWAALELRAKAEADELREIEVFYFKVYLVRNRQRAGKMGSARRVKRRITACRIFLPERSSTDRFEFLHSTTRPFEILRYGR